MQKKKNPKQFMLMLYQRVILPEEVDAEAEMHKHRNFANEMAERDVPIPTGIAL